MRRTRDSLPTLGIVCLTAVLAALVVLPGATGSSLALAQGAAAADKPKAGGVVRMAEREPPNLDPHQNISFLTQNVGSLIYNGLVRLTYVSEQKNDADLTKKWHDEFGPIFLYRSLFSVSCQLSMALILTDDALSRCAACIPPTSRP